MAAAGACVAALIGLALGCCTLLVFVFGVGCVVRIGPGGGRLGPAEFKIVKVGEACCIIWLGGYVGEPLVATAPTERWLEWCLVGGL